ncbi:MAG: hypothetical protein KAR07_05955 [Spirochaetes bacterium]|nr:hypothetical protein [Spirochaetota bacterium]
MGQDLTTSIKKDWIELRSLISDIDQSLNFVGVNKNMHSDLLNFIRPFAENGLYEAKIEIFNIMFTQIEAMLYRTLNKNEINKLFIDNSKMIAICILQRGAALGRIGLKSNDNSQQEENQEKQDIHNVISEIHKISQHNPQLVQKNPNLQNILKLVKTYNEELKKMSNYVSKLNSKEKEKILVSNFQTRFTEIFSNIHSHYAKFKAEIQGKHNKFEQKGLIETLNLEEFQKILIRQIKTFLQIKSSISFTLANQTGFRDIFKRINQNKDEYKKSLTAETGAINLALKAIGVTSNTERYFNECENDLKFRIQYFLEESINENKEKDENV